MSTTRELIIESEEAQEHAVGAFLQGEAVRMLRDALDEKVLESIMQLQGTRSGFITDKKYQAPIVRDAVIEALSNGYRLTGNEFNIIAGSFYPAKNGVLNRILETPYVHSLELDIGVPEGGGKRWLVPCKATFWLRDKEIVIDRTQTDEGDFRIVLPLYNTDKPALVTGKAEARLLRLVHQRITGTNIDVADESISVVTDDPQTVDAVPVTEAAEGEPTSEPNAPKEDFLLGLLRDTFDGQESVIKCQELCDKLLKDESLSADDKTRVRAYCDETVEGIRNSRGQRANGQQG